VKVYDCFTFYNEFELLELRLRALWNVVDYFVIVEANRKHTGEPKIYNFLQRKEEFVEFSSKIRFIPADLSRFPFKGVGDWSLENAQRNAISQGLDDSEPDDLIMISDLDEIIAPDVFQRMRDNQIRRLFDPVVTPSTLVDKKVTYSAWLRVQAKDVLEIGAIVMDQKFHYYYFDWVSRGSWRGTILVKRKNMTTPQALRNLRNYLPRVESGGYHFSYMGGADRVINKMTSIVDGNKLVVKSGNKLVDRAHVEAAMANGTDIYNRQVRKESQFVPFDAHEINLPHIDEFLRKYPHFLREPEKYFDAGIFSYDNLGLVEY